MTLNTRLEKLEAEASPLRSFVVFDHGDGYELPEGYLDGDLLFVVRWVKAENGKETLPNK